MASPVVGLVVSPRRRWGRAARRVLNGPISGPAPTTPVLGVSYVPASSVKAMLGAGNANDFYADIHTFQLVQMVRLFTPLGQPHFTETSDYTWVPRTPALTKLINHPQVPAGFTQVPAQ